MHSRAFHFFLLFLPLLIAPLPAPGTPSFTESTFSTTDFDVMDQIDGNSTPTDANDYYDANGNTLKDENGTLTGDEYDWFNRLVKRGSITLH